MSRHTRPCVWIRRWSTALVMVIAIALLPDVAVSASAADATYPDRIGAVNDFAGILSQQDRSRLEDLSIEIERRTGAAFVLAIVPSTQPETPKMYAVKLFERWGIGSKEKDDGVLVLLDMEQRRIEVEVGYGLEGVLTDGKIGEILDRDVIPRFKEGRFGDGLYAGVQSMSGLLTPTEEPAPAGGGAGPIAVEVLLGSMLVILGLLFAAGAFRRVLSGVSSGLYSRRRCPRCGGVLYVSDRLVRSSTVFAPGLSVRTYRCPSCGFSQETEHRTGPMVGPFVGWPGGHGGGAGGFGRPSGGSRGFGGFGGGRSGGGGAGRSW